jgi:4-hydroxybenzoyl-CoA reductase subunit beta
LLRIGLTGTNSRPFLLAGTDALVGRPIDPEALAEIDRLVQKQVKPMRTTMASAHYRRHAAAALACRLVARLSTGPSGQRNEPRIALRSSAAS